MNIFALPWSVMLLIIIILALLFVREVLISIQIPRQHPERKIAIFNCCLLFTFLIVGAYGMRFLTLRDSEFAALFPRYPNSRYAPERELFGDSGEHIYVTSDTPSAVIHFYDSQAKAAGYSVVIPDDVETSGRMMLEKGSTTLFLTAMKESHTTVLYLSPEGEMKKSALPPR